ncbi:anti-sigma factor domain-containing protein [Pseudahrensia aquimaris]|uniref:Anti-sigma factor domain-containing protein n=1 Tax=Pseudahrensia aquimaris TaxID=744461 RepID=A0ABW3FEF2_9HYPH
MSRQEEQLDAAEYVIGTLSAAERAAFEAVVESDPTAQADVSFWQKMFGDLSSTVSPVIPGDDVWAKIESALPDNDQRQGGLGLADAVQRTNVTQLATGAALGASQAGVSTRTDRETPSSAVAEAAKPRAANDNAGAVERSRSRWRFGAIAASLAALGLGFLLVNDDARSRVDTALKGGAPAQEQVAGGETPAMQSGKEYIAVVNANADQPALIVKVNAETGAVLVRSLGVERPDGKSLELWYVPEGQKAVSVGLVGEGAIDLGDLSAKSGDLLAISVEPQGGAPEGVATGPVIYTGKLIEDVDAR